MQKNEAWPILYLAIFPNEKAKAKRERKSSARIKECSINADVSRPCQRCFGWLARQRQPMQNECVALLLQFGHLQHVLLDTSQCASISHQGVRRGNEGICLRQHCVFGYPNHWQSHFRPLRRQIWIQERALFSNISIRSVLFLSGASHVSSSHHRQQNSVCGTTCISRFSSCHCALYERSLSARCNGTIEHCLRNRNGGRP